NGAGKSTLAKIIAGVINFDDGRRELGFNTIVSYYAQDVADELNPEYDIIETVDGLAEEKSIGQLRSLLGSFLFSGDDVFKKVGILSGGEKSRVALAKILLTKSNFIILDEPTNHLDISSKEVLQNALINFTGSLILVSHDVDFLAPIVNKVVEIRKGHIQTFLGGMNYYLSKRQEILEREEVIKQKENDNGSLTKKDQKRIEAEKRQKRYQATKDIIKEVAGLEKKIEETELKEKELEKLLADSSTYGNPALAKAKTFEYTEVKESLAHLMEQWEQLSIKLTNIEKQFD
ncbi:MAG: ATP-binding cassette domain-containing protein, partial [Ignavibacteriaceae bacterium]|nr:ATP-binding cassette domain-containing protein [Ignavibacteriaceae bacterium]